MRNFLSLYKPYKIAYFFTALGGTVAIMLAFSAAGSRGAAAYLIPFLWILVCAYIFINMTRRKIGELVEGLRACRVGDFISSMEKIVRDCRKGESAKYARLLLSTGYLSYGDLDKAGDVLSSIDQNFGMSSSASVLAMMYYNNCAAYFTERGDIYQAKMNVNSLYYLKSSPDVNRGLALTIDQSIDIRMAHIDLQTRSLDGLAARFRKLFDEAATRLEKVNHAFGLARTAGFCDDRENERFWLSYCAEHGGDSYAGRQARMMLGAQP